MTNADPHMAHLDDNTRTGLHALGLGLLVIGVPVLVIQLIDVYQTVSVTTDHGTLQIFRNGYLLPADGPQFCSATTSRGERLGQAALLALVVGAVLTLLAYPVRATVSNWSVGRWGAGLAFLYCSYAALAMPTATAHLQGNTLTTTQRWTLWGELTLPFPEENTIVLADEANWVIDRQYDPARLFLLQGQQPLQAGTTFAGEDAVNEATEFLDRNPRLD